MKVNRRQFLKLFFGGVTAAGLPAVVAAGTGRQTRPPATPAPVRPAGTVAGAAGPSAATVLASPAAPIPAPPATPLPAVSSAARTARPEGARSVFAWLRMLALPTMPDSGAEYRANLDKVTLAIPLNGGKLQGDGTWLQEGPKLRRAWPRALPGLARDAQHLYMPAVGNDRAGMVAVLDSPDLRTRAATELAALAAGGRFDSPWDGVYLDMEGMDPGYRPQMTDFLYRVADQVHGAGLKLGVSVSGVDVSPGTRPDQTEAHDLAVVAQVADFVDIRCYDYWAPAPKSVGPYWWIERSIQFALQMGIPAQKLTVGLANYSRYWPNLKRGNSQELSHVAAMQLVQQTGAQVQWVERNQHGLVREKMAVIGPGVLWIHDGDTTRAGLELAERYGLLGTALFAPGMGDAGTWDVIGAWQRGEAMSERAA